MAEYIVAIDVTRVRFPADALALAIHPRPCTARVASRSLARCDHAFYRDSLQQVRDSIVVSISACHVEDPGSIPGRGNVLLTHGLRMQLRCEGNRCDLDRTHEL